MSCPCTASSRSATATGSLAGGPASSCAVRRSAIDLTAMCRLLPASAGAIGKGTEVLPSGGSTPQCPRQLMGVESGVPKRSSM